jgi:hypothetical protein
MSGDKGI